LQFASKFRNVIRVPGRPKSKLRSGCPVSRSLEILGDRWSLLVIRDLMIRGAKHFKDFQESGEGIASNILAGRLRKLQEAGIISAEPGETDGRRIDYRLTAKGIDLAPVLLELLLWGGQHEEDSMPRSMIEKMKHHREAILAEVRRRWRERNTTPLQSKTGEWHLP
jgi:DNA-binding HxlR family transcriptional regulator